MTWVEVTGPVGAGKSALMPAILDAWRCAGLRPIEVPGPANGEAARLTTRWHDRARGSVLFLARHRGLVASAAQALLVAPLPMWHRRAIVDLVLRLAAADQGLRGRDPDEVIVVDEGWIHRAINLFAWSGRQEDDRIDRYLERVPRPDLVIMVDAAETIRRERLSVRGLPKRLRDKDPAVVERFLVCSEGLLGSISAWLRRQGVPVISVANDAALAVAEAALRQEIHLVARSRASHSQSIAVAAGPALAPTVRIRRPFPLPRPDTLVAAVSIRRGRDPALIASIREVLEAYGLADRPVRPLSAGGRSRAFLVEAPWGPVLLKRYKPTLSEASIRVEHAILLRLADIGFPSPRLQPTREGITLVDHGGERYAATAWMPGYVRWDRSLVPAPDSRRLRHDSGLALARLHRCLWDFEPPGRHAAQVADADQDQRSGRGWLDGAIARGATASPPPRVRREWASLWDRAGEIVQRASELSAMLESLGLATTIIHGDYGPYNLLIRSGAPLVVIDFELARRDWRLIDLARAVPRFATNRIAFSLKRASQFLTGYRQAEPVTRHEIAALPSLSAYLDLRRTAILWSRYAETGRTSHLAEAAGCLRRADDVLTGDHPLARLANADTWRTD
jgi:Ser/Thr protein kinase RdoA (MazF antagonist)